ncbi:centrosomal protein of 63 kDa-like [Amphiura filiformis]|uniref:centrosomal protein of 63 kDa-like n=1 Tax=Amphiura filiformis TaxID=82378 RepID=UPI003B22286C
MQKQAKLLAGRPTDFQCSDNGDLLQEAREAGLFDGPLSSCETELQELLHQIDIMMSNKHKEWETETETLKLQCQAREHQVVSQRTKLEASQRQVAELNDQIGGTSKAQRQLVTDYEQQLSQLRNQLSNLQKDYERVQKRHSKQASNAEKARDQTVVELQETQLQLKMARNQLMEYEGKVRDWEVQRRAHRQQVEAVESQRTTMAEKYELMQQQSLGYQEQLSKRRQMLEQCELNYKSRLTHVEGQLARAQDTLNGKNATIQDLEERLQNSSSGKMRAEEEYSRQDKQLQILERTNRDLEDRLSQLQVELQSRDDLVAATEQDIRRNNQAISDLEDSLAMKDNIIRNLEESNRGGEAVMIAQMKQQLVDLQSEALQLRQNELHWKDEVDRLQRRLDDSHIECASLNTELAHKISELRHMEGTELQQLAENLIKARGQQQEVEERHQAEMIGMKKEIAALTTDLHERDGTIASLSEELSAVERELDLVNKHKERQEDELKLTNAQLEALQLEHQNLREMRALDVSSTSRDLQQAEIQLQELHQLHKQHVQSSKTLEAENENLRRDLSGIQQQMRSTKHSASPRVASPRASLEGHHSMDSILSQSSARDRKFEEMESAHRKEMDRLQERLDSTVKRYENEIGRLIDEQDRLRTNLRDKYHAIKRLQAENDAMGGFVSSAESIAKSPPSKSVNSSFSSSRSLGNIRSPASRQLFNSSVNGHPAVRQSHSFPELFLSPAQSMLSENERPNSRASITANFVAEDKRRRQQLEQLLDSRLNDLEQRTTETLQRHTHEDDVFVQQDSL